MITNRLREFLWDFYRLNGYIPTKLTLKRSEVLMLCWENDVPFKLPEGVSHTFMEIKVDQIADA